MRCLLSNKSGDKLPHPRGIS